MAAAVELSFVGEVGITNGNPSAVRKADVSRKHSTCSHSSCVDGFGKSQQLVGILDAVSLLANGANAVRAKCVRLQNSCVALYIIIYSLVGCLAVAFQHGVLIDAAAFVPRDRTCIGADCLRPRG